MDDSCRCCNCRFFDGFDSRCKLNPPAYAGDCVDEKTGETIRLFAQPIIEIEWAEWCGQWQAADDYQTKEKRHAQIESLFPHGDGP